MAKPKFKIGETVTVLAFGTGEVVSLLRINSSWAYKVRLSSGNVIEALDKHVEISVGHPRPMVD